MQHLIRKMISQGSWSGLKVVGIRFVVKMVIEGGGCAISTYSLRKKIINQFQLRKYYCIWFIFEREIGVHLIYFVQLIFLYNLLDVRKHINFWVFYHCIQFSKTKWSNLVWTYPLFEYLLQLYFHGSCVLKLISNCSFVEESCVVLLKLLCLLPFGYFAFNVIIDI